MKRTFLITLLSGATLFAQTQQAQTQQERQAADQAKLAAAQAKLAAGQATAAELEARKAEVEARKAELEARQVQLRQGAFAEQTVQFVSGLVNGPTVKAAPYSAEAVTETTQTLSDGNRIEQKTSSKQYRDGEGRERHEESSGMNAVFITDPIAKLSYTLHPETKTAERSSIRANFVFATKGDAAARGEKMTVTYTAAMAAPIETRAMGTVVAGVVARDFAVAAPLQSTFAGPQTLMFTNAGPGGSEPKLEDLGTRSIEGVQAAGNRSTMTIPAGQIGNIRPIEIVDENWYSPELQMTVMTRHSDPRSGETVFKLTNIRRIEPVRQLFELPSDYTLVVDRVTGAAKLADDKLKQTQDIIKAFEAAQRGRKE